MRLQWNPDHAPNGSPSLRRAVQLGLRGETLQTFNAQWLQHIEDITEFVKQQRENVGNLKQLLTPKEEVYSLPIGSLRFGYLR